MGEQFSPRGPYGEMGVRGPFPNASAAMRAMRPPGPQQFPQSPDRSSPGIGFPPGVTPFGPRHPSQYMDVREHVSKIPLSFDLLSCML